MPRTSECFHDQLEALYQRFGRDRGMISLLAAAQYLDVDQRTLLTNKDFPIKKLGNAYKVPIVPLARWLSN